MVLTMSDDADHDPADRAHQPVDGALERDAARARGHPPALSDALRVDDPDGRPLDRLVRRADDHQREHPL